MEREFRLSLTAEQDLTDIWGYVADYDEAPADELIDQLVKRFLMLSNFQDAGRRREELAPGLRSFPVKQYIIFYRVIPEGIEVIRVLHGSRDMDQVFAEAPAQDEVVNDPDQRIGEE
ncbi:MAG: type II toxin-antitoxin system RelE/ParE family toxin [Cyanobacteria bacterium J06639_14]